MVFVMRKTRTLGLKSLALLWPGSRAPCAPSLQTLSSAEFMTSSSESKSSRTAKAASPEPVASSYEAALGELERLVSQLDAGQLPLDQLLTHYQRGAQLLAYCREKLDAVENQIRVLEANELKPWDAS